MNKLDRTLRILCATTLLTLAACSKESTIPERTETIVAATGGTAISAAGELTLQIPAGAVPDGTRVIIITDRTQDSRVVGPAFQLDTEPRVTSFSPTIGIALKNPQPSQTVAVANLDGATPVPVGDASYDATTHVAHGQLAHFSRYGLISITSSVSCPTATPTPNSACVGQGLQCDFGQECCCGACYPSLSCTCSGGTWACFATDACLGAGQCMSPDAGTADTGTADSGSADAGDACSSEATVNNAACTDLGLVCDYGQETCCGQSFPAMQCQCDGTTFACRPTDACLAFPTCGGTPFTESEPNDDRPTADVLPAAQNVLVSARIGSGDVDVFSFTVTSTPGVAGTIRARTHTLESDPDSCDGLDTELLLLDGRGGFVARASDGPTPPCAHLTQTVPPGAYYLVVSTSTGTGIPQHDYYVTIDLGP